MAFSRGSVILIMSSIVGCGGASPSLRDSASSQTEVEEEACSAVVQLARACYDRGSSSADCESFGDFAQEQMARSGAGARVQQLTGEICQAGCQARKEGYEFSRVRGKIRNAICLASR